MKVTGYTKLAILLAQRIEKEFGYKVIPIIHRTRYSRDQRSAGAISWYMNSEDGGFTTHVGSYSPAKECLKAKFWGVSYKSPGDFYFDIGN